MQLALVHKTSGGRGKRDPSAGGHGQEAEAHVRFEALTDASPTQQLQLPCRQDCGVPVPPLVPWRSHLQTAALTQSPWSLAEPVAPGPRSGDC